MNFKKNWNNAPNAYFTISQDGKVFKTVNISPIHNNYTAATSQKTKFDLIANEGSINLTFTVNGGNLGESWSNGGTGGTHG